MAAVSAAGVLCGAGSAARPAAAAMRCGGEDASAATPLGAQRPRTGTLHRLTGPGTAHPAVVPRPHVPGLPLAAAMAAHTCGPPAVTSQGRGAIRVTARVLRAARPCGSDLPHRPALGSSGGCPASGFCAREDLGLRRTAGRGRAGVLAAAVSNSPGSSTLDGPVFDRPAGALVPCAPEPAVPATVRSSHNFPPPAPTWPRLTGQGDHQ
jgi:hypothetical protein